jgi:hypothetical protein
VRTALLLIAIALAGLVFAVMRPAIAFSGRVEAAARAEPACLDPRIVAATRAAILRSRGGMVVANRVLQGRLFPRPDNHLTTLAAEVVRVQVGGLVAGPDRTASGFCAIGNSGGARFNLPSLAARLEQGDLAKLDDCQLNALADLEAGELRRLRDDIYLHQAFAARTKACPSR